MLTSLSVDHFALMQHAALTFEAGFTVITGRTGSGKSMLFHAISLILGAKGQPSLIATDQPVCTLKATFNVEHNAQVGTWLDAMNLPHTTILTIERTLKRKGRGQQCVNGHNITLSELKTLGECLVAIQGQHDHLRIKNPTYTLDILDAIANCDKAKKATAKAYQTWLHYHTLQQQHNDPAKLEARAHLLDHYLEEIEQLEPKADEWHTLIQQHDKQQRAQDIQMALSAFYQQCCGDHNQVADTLYQHLKTLQTLPQDDAMQGLCQTLSDAYSLLQEAGADAESQLTPSNDALDLEALEARISQYHTLARKHQIPPEQLHRFTEELMAEKQNIEQHLSSLDQQEQALQDAHLAWQQAADQLAAAREAVIPKVLRQLREGMQKLGMPYAQCHLECKRSHSPNAHGHTTYPLWVSTNPDRPMQPIAQVASGGEKSRIALVLQQMSHLHQSGTTLIFDEADTGISGEVASQVGQLLRAIGQQSQVLCITHLPQVACLGQQHILVAKTVAQRQTHVTCQTLNGQARTQAIASMLASDAIGDAALAQAQSLLLEHA